MLIDSKVDRQFLCYLSPALGDSELKHLKNI